MSFKKIVFVLIIFSLTQCGGGDEPIDPTPDTNFTHTININGNEKDTDYTIWDNGYMFDVKTSDAQGDVKFVFDNKEKVTIIDSIIGFKEGFTKFKQFNQSIGSIKNYTAVLNEIATNKFGDLNVMLHDTNSNQTIKNFLGIHNQDTTAVDSVYTLTDLVAGNTENVKFIPSDSTWINFPDTNTDFVIAEGENNLLVDVDGTIKTFSATYNLDVDDTNNNTLKNLQAIIAGDTLSLPTNGVATSVTFPLTANANQPWLAQPQDISVTIQQTDSSYQITPVTFTKTLVDGINNDTRNITSIPFEWYANLIVNVDDENATDLPGVTLNANGKTATTNSAGQARLDSIVSLPALSAEKFWQPGSANITYDLIKDGYQDFTAKTVSVNQGDNTYNETLNKIATNTLGNLNVMLYDTNSNQTIKNFLGIHNQDTTAVDSVYTLTDLIAGNTENVKFIPSDSTWINFPDTNTDFVIAQGENNSTINVNGTVKTFSATYNLDVDDTNNNTLKNLQVIIDGTAQSLPTNGVATSITFPLTANANQPWLAQPQDISVTIQQTDSSYQITPVTFTKTLVDGINNDTRNITSIPFEWYANLIVNVDDENATDLPGVTLNANSKTATTNSAGQAQLNSVISLPALSTNQFWLPGSTNLTYDLIKDGYQDFTAKTVSVNQGDNTYNETLNKIITASVQNGDVAIETLLNNSPHNNTTIKLTNSIVPDSTYTISTTPTTAQAIFYDIYVSDANNPTTYNVNITDNLSDGTFLETNTTIQVYQDVNGEINGSKIVNLNEIPNSQDLTTMIREYNTLSPDGNVTVDLIKNSDGSVIDSQITDGSGAVTFANVPGETAVHIKESEAGSYTITYGTYTTPLVDHVSEMTNTINATSVPQFSDRDGVSITAADIQKYKPLEYNTEFLLGHLRVYFPAINGGNQVYKDHFATVATELGMSGAILAYDTSFATPTAQQISDYNPYPSNRQVFDGLIGTNITNYSGGATTNLGKILSNGNQITISTSQFNLGGLDWSDTDHEIGNALGFPSFAGNTSRSSDAATNMSIADSPQDSAIMPLWIKIGKDHYDSTDSQGRLINYSLPTKFE